MTEKGFGVSDLAGPLIERFNAIRCRSIESRLEDCLTSGAFARDLTVRYYPIKVRMDSDGNLVAQQIVEIA